MHKKRIGFDNDVGGQHNYIVRTVGSIISSGVVDDVGTTAAWAASTA